MRAERLPTAACLSSLTARPEGYEWFVTLVVLVGLYFAVRNFMRAHPPSPPKYLKKANAGRYCSRRCLYDRNRAA